MGKHRSSTDSGDAGSTLRRPLRATTVQTSLQAAPEPASAPAHAAAPPSERLADTAAHSSHIPGFLVRPHGAAGADDLDVSGSYRFPTCPTPVIRASITLMGLDRVERASRMRVPSYTYRCARMGPAGERLGPTATAPGATTRSRRWPNV